MRAASQLIRLTCIPLAMGAFLIAAQVAGGFVARDEIGHVAK